MNVSRRIRRVLQRRHLTTAFLLLLLIAVCRIEPASAIFTDAEDNTNNILSTATLDISTSAASAIFNVANLVPGDTVSRSVTVSNSGSVPFTYEVTNTSQTNTLLWTDKINGLQLEIKQASTVYYSGPVSDLNVNAGSDFSLSASSSHGLDFKLTFPVTAGNSFQNLTERMTFTFSATQLPGAAR